MNEAAFLFDPKDKLPELMKSFLKKTDTINRSLIDMGNILDPEIIEIRKKVEPYLVFHQITLEEKNECLAETRTWLKKLCLDFRGK